MTGRPGALPDAFQDSRASLVNHNLWPSSHRPAGGRIDVLERHFGLLSQFPARFKFGRGLHDLAIEFAKFDGHLTVRSFHRDELATEFPPFSHRASDAKCAGL